MAEGYDYVIVGGGSAGTAGQPALPTYTRLVALPAGSGVTVRVLQAATRSLGVMQPEPRQPVVEQGKSAPTFDPALYAAAQQGPVVAVYVLDDEAAGDHKYGGASRWWRLGSAIAAAMHAEDN